MIVVVVASVINHPNIYPRPRPRPRRKGRSGSKGKGIENNNGPVLCRLLLLAIVTNCAVAIWATTSRPNVVFIVADDLNFLDAVFVTITKYVLRQ